MHQLGATQWKALLSCHTEVYGRVHIKDLTPGSTSKRLKLAFALMLNSNHSVIYNETWLTLISDPRFIISVSGRSEAPVQTLSKRVSGLRRLSPRHEGANGSEVCWCMVTKQTRERPRFFTRMDLKIYIFNILMSPTISDNVVLWMK